MPGLVLPPGQVLTVSLFDIAMRPRCRGHSFSIISLRIPAASLLCWLGLDGIQSLLAYNFGSEIARTVRGYQGLLV